MTTKLRERLVNLGITVLTSFGAVFLSFALFSGESSSLRIDSEIKKKADIDYVDSRDREIKEDLSTYKVEHQIQHSGEYNSLDKKMDVMHEDMKEMIRMLQNTNR